MLVKVWVIPLLYLDFEIRRDYIVANLCENRTRPQLNCNGQCFLAKKLAAVQEQQEKEAAQNYVIKLIDAPAQLLAFYQLSTPIHRIKTIIKTGFIYSSLFIIGDVASDIFHPPIIA